MALSIAKYTLRNNGVERFSGEWKPRNATLLSCAVL